MNYSLHFPVKMTPAAANQSSPAKLLVSNVECIKGDLCLFDSVNFSITAGQGIYIKGSNGTGKTSLIRIIAGLSLPEQGEIRWADVDIRHSMSEYRQIIRFVGHLDGHSQALTPRQNLQFTAAQYEDIHADEIDASLKKLGIFNKADIPCRMLSRGQRQRLSLCRLLLGRSKIWILDEPVTALDTDIIETIEFLMEAHLAKQGILVFSSHQPLSLRGHKVLEFDLDAHKVNRNTSNSL